jgi:4-diphosphocytidyl-2-C-methyl-D-erythritol kinase
MVKLLAERAFAKINLFLRVTGRRQNGSHADGYHELDSIFVPVSIGDRVTLEMRPAATSRVTLRCNLPALADAESNLASRAARDFMREFAISADVAIDLHKTIPAGAGLGGGSSDAGTVLRMMATMTHTDSIERLRKVAVDLGADVPFFLDPRPSRVSGIGERIEALEKFPLLHLVIAVPPIVVPTASVFKELKREGWSGPASSGEIEEILRGKISARHLVNDLEAPAMQLFPQISHLKALLQECGAKATSMTGSGGAVFGLFPDASAAARATDEVRQRMPEARVFTAESLAA